LQRQWTPAVLDVSKHHGYALQWFALSALITGLYVWFQLIRPRRRSSR
jgi:surfeit locus 1 family protein